MQEPIKKILDRERIHIHLKNKMISKWYWFALLVFLSAATYAMFYAACCWLFVCWIIVVHIVFGVIGVAILAVLVKNLLPILTLARMVKGDRYLLVEDEIDGLVSRIEMQGEATLFFLLKDAAERSQLLAMFMGLLELIKLKRVLICDSEEEDPEDEVKNALLMRFTMKRIN